MIWATPEVLYHLPVNADGGALAENQENQTTRQPKRTVVNRGLRYLFRTLPS